MRGRGTVRAFYAHSVSLLECAYVGCAELVPAPSDSLRDLAERVFGFA